MNTRTPTGLSAKEAAIVAVVSAALIGTVAYLFYFYSPEVTASHRIYRLPMINAGLNALTTFLLVLGYRAIRRRDIRSHQRWMVGALVASLAFLAVYVVFHASAPPTSYGGEGVMRYVYYFLLITHIILAAVVAPLALATVLLAWRGRFATHRKIARFTLPIWLYVAVSGLLVYLMIRPYYPA